jgi:flagellar motor switch protein FliM
MKEQESDGNGSANGAELSRYEAAKSVAQNLSVPLVVELARKHFSVLELGKLESGQVIELSCVPGDLVDLVAAGKIIGKGELVDIEGEIGVRIVSLVED